MSYRSLRLAPISQVPEAARGKVGGRFCRGCGNIYPHFASRHQGKPLLGKDHVSSPCVHEGRDFAAQEEWWEPAVELLLESTSAESGG